MTSKTTLIAVLLTATLTWAGASNLKSEAKWPRVYGVRTTAYSGGSGDNGPYGPKNALGQPLRSGKVSSAAADWSRWPLGTRFRVVETGDEFIVDDYGSAMVGNGTIDLYKSSNAKRDRWGVRRITIEIIEWGSPERSLQVLRDRTRMRHVREMVNDLLDQRAG